MSMKNCLYDKALHATVKKCNCRPSFYVLGEVYSDLEICKGKELDCAFEVFDNVESPSKNVTETKNVTEKCQQPCNDQLYNTRWVKIFISRYDCNLIQYSINLLVLI